MIQVDEKVWAQLNKKVSALETLAQMVLNECYDARALATGIGTPVATPKGAKKKRTGKLSEEEIQGLLFRHRNGKKPITHS